MAYNCAKSVADTRPPQRHRAHSSRTRWAVALTVLIVGAGVMTGWGLYWALTYGAFPGPTLIEELKAGSITTADIEKVEILKWPEPDRPGFHVGKVDDWYREHKRVPVKSDEAIVELVEILRDLTTARGHKSHPVFVYRSLLRIETKNGAYYYLFCPVYYDQHKLKRNYVPLRSGSKCTVNPNGAKEYDNVRLADFLRTHDPWFGQKR